MSTDVIQRIEGYLAKAARNRAQQVAVVDGDRQIDYGTFHNDSRWLASRVREFGVESGDRVGILLDKTYEAAVAFYSVWLAGGVAVPINEGLRSAQVKHILDDSGARLLISTSRKLSGLDKDAYASAEILQPEIGAALEPSNGHGRPLPGGDEPAIILYTSGSTGLPKGILVSHENLVAGSRIVSTYLEIAEDERILSILPFSFDYGLNQLLTAVYRTGTLYLQRSLFPADICRSLQDHEITALAGVPTLWIQLMQGFSPFSKLKFPHLRYITNSGGAFPVELVKRYREHLPHVRLYLMYGLSEAFRSSYLPPSQVDVRPDSMGRAMPETELLVLDENDKECPPGTPGQLVHVGPTVSLGYWNRPEATARVFRKDPRLPPEEAPRAVYSGDLVRKDEEGYLYFVGRADQQLKSFGFRISPEEVEHALYRSDMLAEVIVRGVPDEVAGTAIEAHVIPRDPKAFQTELLLAYCGKEMPRYMVPQVVHVHETLPRTSSGKVDRKKVGQ